MKRPHRNHSTTFKAKVALAAIRGDRSRTEFTGQFNVQIGQWRTLLPECAADASATTADRRDAGPDPKRMDARIGHAGVGHRLLVQRARSRAEAPLPRVRVRPMPRRAGTDSR